MDAAPALGLEGTEALNFLTTHICCNRNWGWAGAKEGRAKEGSSGRPVEASTASSVHRAFQLKSGGVQKHGHEPVYGYFPSVTPDRKNSHTRKTDGKA